jgi:hypothetical protein
MFLDPSEFNLHFMIPAYLSHFSGFLTVSTLHVSESLKLKSTFQDPCEFHSVFKDLCNSKSCFRVNVSVTIPSVWSLKSSYSFSYHNEDLYPCVRALGQGAFGEVYQGYFKKSSTDSMEMPVAVKTLPELSTNQGKYSRFSHF